MAAFLPPPNSKIDTAAPHPTMPINVALLMFASFRISLARIRFKIVNSVWVKVPSMMKITAELRRVVAEGEGRVVWA